MISVIIPNYNGASYLKPCLDSVLLQSGGQDIEIVLIDNGSQDGSAELVRERFPSVRVIANAENLGFTRAVNQGIAAASGELLLLLNNDTVMQPGSLLKLQRSLESFGDEAAGVQPLLLWAGDGEIIDSAGIAIEPKFVARDDLRGQPRASAPTEEREIFGVCFACALLRRSVFDRCGLLDPDFYAEWDDVEFCLRARWHGYRFFLIPGARVLHHRSPTSQREPLAKFMHRRRNHVLTYLKGLPAASAFGQTLYRLQKDIGNIPHFVKARELRAVAASWIEVMKLLPVMLARRRRLRRKAVLSAWQMRALLRRFMQRG
ncbi:MAG: glycosyltransferase family 2 protein [bacterium]|nr:glycosyltransferase family 2 protein [bacterium]